MAIPADPYRNLGPATIPAFAGELDTVLARQTRYEDHSDRTKGSKVTPLFFDDRASEAGWVLRNTLSTWVRLVAEERGIPLPEGP